MPCSRWSGPINKVWILALKSLAIALSPTSDHIQQSKSKTNSSRQDSKYYSICKQNYCSMSKSCRTKYDDQCCKDNVAVPLYIFEFCPRDTTPSSRSWGRFSPSNHRQKFFIAKVWKFQFQTAFADH